MNTMRIGSLVMLCGLLCACCRSEILPEVTADTMPHTVQVTAVERGNLRIEREMRAILAGNPVNDAERALQTGDKRLWAYDKRGRIIPGLPSSAQMPGDDAIIIAPGMGDVVYGKTHQQLRQALLEYMQQYNRHILAAD